MTTCSRSGSATPVPHDGLIDWHVVARQAVATPVRLWNVPPRWRSKDLVDLSGPSDEFRELWARHNVDALTVGNSSSTIRTLGRWPSAIRHLPSPAVWARHSASPSRHRADLTSRRPPSRSSAPPPETRFLERDEIEDLLRHLPSDGPLALRDRALILFLYNTGARAQEAADLRAEHLDLGTHPLARLHGKGGKWRTCPLWQQTAQLLTTLLGPAPAPGAPVFAAHGQPLTRYGIYKIIRRHAARFDDPRTGRRISPHTFRHTAAVHLLEAGVEVNVIRGWLGHADLATTNRYAEINTKTKLADLQATEPHDVRRDPGLTQSGDQTNPCSTGSPHEVPRGFRTVRPLGWTIWKGEIFCPDRRRASRRNSRMKP